MILEWSAATTTNENDYSNVVVAVDVAFAANKDDIE
jgi:hypothetical protein